MSSFTELVLLAYVMDELHSCICNLYKEDGSCRLRGENQVPKIMEGSRTMGRSNKACAPYTSALHFGTRKII